MTGDVTWIYQTIITLGGTAFALLVHGSYFGGKFSSRLEQVEDTVKDHEIELDKKASVLWVEKIEGRVENAQTAAGCREFRTTMMESTHRIEAAVADIQRRFMNGAAKPTGLGGVQRDRQHDTNTI